MELCGNGFFTGINYWESKHATRMWQEFDENTIREDFRRLREAGVTALRIFPLWSDFQPLTGFYTPSGIFEMGMEGAPRPDTPAGKAGVSEVMCERFHCLCVLAEEAKLELIVGLITGQMSFGLFMPQALQGRGPISDPTVLRWELRFVKYFVTRFREEKAIVGWDLGNEVNCLEGGLSPDAFAAWCTAIADAIRVCDPTRPVISGMVSEHTDSGIGSMREAAEFCDVHTVHSYNIFSLPGDPLTSMRSMLRPSVVARQEEDIGGIPAFIQEFGAIGYMTCSYEEEAQFYRGALNAAYTLGCRGAMWWCAFDQGDMDFPPYNWNNIGSQYGFFTKDGEEKPVAKVNREFASVLKAVPELPNRICDTCILVERDGGRKEDPSIQLSAFCLARRAGLSPRFAYALDPIPDAKLYIFPSVRSNMAITKTRWRELLGKVENGATLLVTADTALFRELPETFGAVIRSRQEKRGTVTVETEWGSVPVSCEYRFRAEAAGAEVLCRDTQGNPALFSKAFGKGRVLLSLLPVEHTAADDADAFSRENRIPYEAFYRMAADGLETQRVCRTDDPWIALTEHPFDGGRYVCAVNDSVKEKTAKIAVPCGKKLTAVYGNAAENGAVTLPGCGMAIYRLEEA